MDEMAINDLQSLPPVVGVDLGGTQIRVAVLHGARLLARVSLPTGKDSNPNCIIPRIFRAIQQVLDESCTSLSQIAGIGFGVPGPIDNHTGIVCMLPNLPGWEDLPLGDIFKEQY